MRKERLLPKSLWLALASLKSGFGGTAQSPLVPQIVFVLTRAWRGPGLTPDSLHKPSARAAGFPVMEDASSLFLLSLIRLCRARKSRVGTDRRCRLPLQMRVYFSYIA